MTLRSIPAAAIVKRYQLIYSFHVDDRRREYVQHKQVRPDRLVTSCCSPVYF